MSENLDRLRHAYDIWDQTKGGRVDIWLDLMDDNVVIRSLMDPSHGLDFAGVRYNRREAGDYLTAILKDWSMDYWRPDRFVEQGNQIAMLGTCAWNHRATNRSAEVLIAHFWTFNEHGRIVEMVEVFDSARAQAAATGG